MTRFPFFHALSCSLLALASQALGWQPSGESVPAAPQEFRAAWISTVHNIDWPSRSGLSGAAQRAELLTILNTCAQLKLNAVFLQVRPNADALYQSSLEPWSQWLSGPGVNPGYDPLAFAIQEAHRRGIELHAWFNPFRAKANVKHAVGRNHISLTRPDLMKRNGSVLLMNPSASASRDHAMRVILDVVRRYDIDGVHLDDYFYPYPTPGRTWSPASFSDGKSPSQRRACIDDFVHDMYKSVKSSKPWVRVGISPFGIWRPGVPGGIEAGVDAYEHLACDARKWLSRGWVDYLAPQLYWRCSPAKQSFPVLMQWWAAQNTSRPVWPGIATARIMSSEDPGRPASEIAAQVNYSRSLARTAPGQCFWSVKSIMRNAGGIQKYLNRLYPSMAVPPAMPWCGTGTPGQPQNFLRGGQRFHRNPFLAAVRQSLPEMGRPGALRQPVGHAHPSAGQPDPRDAAQILPGGCRVRLRQGRQRLRSPGPRRGGQKVGSFFRQPPAGKEKNARCSKFF